jgi:type II secretory pathway component PulF
MSFRAFCLNHYIFLLFCAALTYGSITIGHIFFKFRLGSIWAKIPVVKSLQEDLEKLDFFTSMTVLLLGGIHTVEAIGISSAFIQYGVTKMLAPGILAGETLFAAMKESSLFSAQELAVIDISDKTNSTAFAFKSLSAMTKTRITNKLIHITSLIQPTVIIIIGLLLLSVIYSVLTPLYDNLSLG